MADISVHDGQYLVNNGSEWVIFGGFHTWWYPNSWLICNGKSHLEIDDLRVAPWLRKPPHVYSLGFRPYIDLLYKVVPPQWKKWVMLSHEYYRYNPHSSTLKCVMGSSAWNLSNDIWILIGEGSWLAGHDGFHQIYPWFLGDDQWLVKFSQVFWGINQIYLPNIQWLLE